MLHQHCFLPVVDYYMSVVSVGGFGAEVCRLVEFECGYWSFFWRDWRLYVATGPCDNVLVVPGCV